MPKLSKQAIEMREFFRKRIKELNEEINIRDRRIKEIYATVEEMKKAHMDDEKRKSLVIEKLIEGHNQARLFVMWMLTGGVGISSRALIKYIMTGEPPKEDEAPHDEDDWGRCRRVLLSYPEEWEPLETLADKMNSLTMGHEGWNVYLERVEEILAIRNDKRHFDMENKRKI